MRFRKDRSASGWHPAQGRDTQHSVALPGRSKMVQKRRQVAQGWRGFLEPRHTSHNAWA
ncbi:hypothetical protein DF3PA_130037 [Candidatus Defluviicoccus seviourii]|uniref:Uncharacterized protein n=2 Tax=root TaxID=1 RepID=A0A564WBN8_9PROT|nr:hypothetical protein DF3PB_70016 [uncultured Defluviicoccus sp.]VUX45539.1 hypothetical protein DF3PA_130037 [Candidatus Defluviicoccus seviourii]